MRRWCELLCDQFPELADLPLQAAGEGFDNFLFQLGDRRAVRLPRRLRGVEPMENELRWLTLAARHVTLATPLPVFTGSPSPRYPWPWMITSWISGVSGDEVDDTWLRGCAEALASFLRELHVTAPDGAPINPWRSVALDQRALDLRAASSSCEVRSTRRTRGRSSNGPARRRRGVHRRRGFTAMSIRATSSFEKDSSSVSSISATCVPGTPRPTSPRSPHPSVRHARVLL